MHSPDKVKEQNLLAILIEKKADRKPCLICELHKDHEDIWDIQTAIRLHRKNWVELCSITHDQLEYRIPLPLIMPLRDLERIGESHPERLLGQLQPGLLENKPGGPFIALLLTETGFHAYHQLYLSGWEKFEQVEKTSGDGRGYENWPA